MELNVNIMDYTKMINKEKAFNNFLTQQIRKKEITICYYKLKTNKDDFDFSYIGYKTNNGGLFGIHYDRKWNNFYFGTRNNRMKSTLSQLLPQQVQDIPEFLKTVLLNVSTAGHPVTMAKP